MTSAPSRRIGIGGGGGDLDFSFKGGGVKGRRLFGFFAWPGRAAVELAAEALDWVLGPHPMDAP